MKQNGSRHNPSVVFNTAIYLYSWQKLVRRQSAARTRGKSVEAGKKLFEKLKLQCVLHAAAALSFFGKPNDIVSGAVT
jgi:hypothetical protein